MRRIKETKAITLIALVITIIVLLILAGVSISAITSDDGILSRASDVKTQTVVGKEKDVLSMAYSSCQTDKLFEGDVTPEELKTKIEGYNENVEVTKSGKTLVVKYLDTGNEYKINQSGEIVDSSNSTQPIGEGIYAKLYSYNDGSGNLLEFSSDENYLSKETGVTLKEDYGDISNIEYGIKGRYDEEADEWIDEGTILPDWIISDEDIIKVKIVDEIAPINMACWFFELSTLEEIENLNKVNTSNVEDMSYLFYFCDNLIEIDLSNFDTSNVTNMCGMFSCCYSITELDVSDFDTSKVTDMSNMFHWCSRLTNIDVSGFDTSNVTNMSGMFINCTRLTALDVSNFDTSDVTDMSSMFAVYSLPSNYVPLEEIDVSNFDTSNVINMSEMFRGNQGLTNIDVSGFETSKVTNMESMFMGCIALTTLDLSNFNTVNVSNMECMFEYCRKITELDISNFNTKNAIDMRRMFANCDLLQNVYIGENWVTTQADVTNMFNGCGTSSVTLKTE